nr:hypothetical protein [Bacteroidota bacterium]
METLLELSKINSNNSRIINSLIPEDHKSPLRKLNHILQNTKYALDESKVMNEIYGKKNTAAFARLKSRMKDILLRATILQNIGLESAESRINESYNQFRYTLVSKILKDLKAERLSVDIAEKALIKSIKFQTTENTVLLLRSLVRHYGAREFNKYKLSKYLSLQKKYLKIFEWEIKAENFHLDLQRIQLHSLAAPGVSTIEKARLYVKEIESVKDIASVNFNLNKYRIKASLLEYENDYNSLLKLCEESLVNFSIPELKSGVIIQNINLSKMLSLIQLGRNEDAVVMGQKELSKISSGSLGWYFLAHYTLKSMIYQSQYSKAIFLIKQMVENQKYSKLGENYKELFNTTLG